MAFHCCCCYTIVEDFDVSNTIVEDFDVSFDWCVCVVCVNPGSSFLSTYDRTQHFLILYVDRTEINGSSQMETTWCNTRQIRVSAVHENSTVSCGTTSLSYYHLFHPICLILLSNLRFLSSSSCSYSSIVSSLVLGVRSYQDATVVPLRTWLHERKRSKKHLLMKVCDFSLRFCQYQANRSVFV